MVHICCLLRGKYLQTCMHRADISPAIAQASTSSADIPHFCIEIKWQTSTVKNQVGPKSSLQEPWRRRGKDR